jgi:hypothetical protein
MDNPPSADQPAVVIHQLLIISLKNAAYMRYILQCLIIVRFGLCRANDVTLKVYESHPC